MFLIMVLLKCIIPAKEVMAKDLENMIMKNQSLITKYGRCVESGTCGATKADHLKYSIYEEINDSKADSEKEHTLVIAGTGKMADYKTEYEMPWVAHSDFDSNGVLWNATYHLVLENGITRIGNNAFYGRLEGELKIPSSVKEIGNNAFEFCILDGELVIPSSVKTIGNYAFDSCCFKKLTILDGVEIIGNNAFDFGLFLDELEPIVIPTSVTRIGNEVFGLMSTLSGGIVISNPNCNIGKDLAGDYNTIYGYANSTAQKYAEEHGIKFCLYKKEEVKIKNLKNANISLSQTSYKFNGNKRTPSVKVTYGSKKLTSGSDYTITYKNNRYVGTAEVQIKGTGSYTGTVTKKFKIVSPGSVTIKFDKNTKSRTAKVSKSSIKVSRGMQYGKLPTATLKGYKFAGWYTAKKNGKKIESKSYVENNPAKTLYAGWKRATYKIQYNCDGGKNAKVNPTSYTIASKKITLQEPSRTGYSFSGWYNAKGKKVSAIPAGSTGDITLKAKWTPIKYIIRFNGNSSTNGRMSDISVKYGEKRTLPDNKYRKNGYTFLYWKAKVDGKTKKLNNREKVSNLASENNAVITLTAVWQKNTNTARKDGKTVTIVNPSDSKEGFRYSAFYTDKYFQKTNSLATAKGGLAKLSAVAALSTYGSNGVNAKELLDDCGFYDILSKNTGTSSRKNNHNARVYLGHSKKMSDGSVVVAVLLNGYTSGRYEWISNFELGTGKYHEGFNIASDKVVTIVKKYIQSEHLQNVKLWITGHSRGAALTNMVAIKMIDAGSIRADQIYAYGFATPQYTTRSGSGYSTIINYVSPHDFVPYVAPAEWGYKRFGHNIVFDDTISGTAIAKYNSYSGRKVYFGKSSYRKKLVKAFVKLGKNPLEYGVVRSWPLGDTVSGYGKVMFSAKEVAQNGIALFMTKDKDEGLDNCLKYSANSSEVLTLMTLLGGGEALMNYITDTHSMLMYLAWIDTLYPTSGQSRPFL